ncbi:MAG: Sec-independent protein translocase TatB [Salinibacterium sp.]|nr:MAG: Sec-independent protein translocase TatB [Salinibacterium sp.]
MSFGLTFDKLLIIGVIALILLGPERLPHYAAQLARLVRSLRALAVGAKERMREEMGPDFDDIDWKQLDPRQYDPRRIIREALLEEPTAQKPVSQGVRDADAHEPEGASAVPTGTKAAPFDSEAT